MESLGPKNPPDAIATPSTAGCWSVPQMSQVQRTKRPASVTRLCNASRCLSQNWSKKKVKVKTARSGGGKGLVHGASERGGKPQMISFCPSIGLSLQGDCNSVKAHTVCNVFCWLKRRGGDICNSICKTHRFYCTTYLPNFTLNWPANLVLMGKERFPKGPSQPDSFLLLKFTPVCCICITLWVGKIRNISICPVLAEDVIK